MRNVSTIPQSELRNNIAGILEQVRNGETIEIPPSVSTFERLLRSGSARPSNSSQMDLRVVPRFKPEASTADMLADLRGRK